MESPIKTDFRRALITGIVVAVISSVANWFTVQSTLRIELEVLKAHFQDLKERVTFLETKD